MPSPIAHIAAGYAVFCTLRNPGTGDSQLLLRAAIVFSLLPDVDSVVGLAARDFARYHNNISHSLGFALAAGALAGMLWGWKNDRFWRWFLVGFLSYGIHIGLDYWSTQRGLLLLWPFSSQRFIAPFKLFYGLQWGLGLRSITHLWTALTELAFVLALITSTHLLMKRLRA